VVVLVEFQAQQNRHCHVITVVFLFGEMVYGASDGIIWILVDSGNESHSHSAAENSTEFVAIVICLDLHDLLLLVLQLLPSLLELLRFKNMGSEEFGGDHRELCNELI